jgi:DNA-directed RNA polymerase specialized sigma24 family protein
MRVQERFSREEIAAAHGVSEAAIKTRLLRARARFAAAYRRIREEVRM